MKALSNRREFLEGTAAIAGGSLVSSVASPVAQIEASLQVDSHQSPVKVVVWDEQQPAQKQAYANFLGNQIADHLGEPGRNLGAVRQHQ